MRIAICEDEAVVAKELADQTQKILFELGIVTEIDVFFSAHDFENATGKYDLLLLDCRLGNDSGMEVARRLRARGSNVAIVFVTAYDDYVYEGYEVNAYRYLLKPIQPDVLRKTLSDFISYYEKERYLDIMTNKHEVRLNLNEIMYIESTERHSIIRHISGFYETAMPIAQLQGKINSFAFFRTHRRFIVNMKYIVEVEDGLIRLSNDERIEISRRKLPTFNKCYMNYLKYSV